MFSVFLVLGCTWYFVVYPRCLGLENGSGVRFGFPPAPAGFTVFYFYRGLYASLRCRGFYNVGVLGRASREPEIARTAFYFNSSVRHINQP